MPFPVLSQIAQTLSLYAHARGGRWDTALSVSLNEKWMRLKLDKLKLDQVNLQNVLKVRKPQASQSLSVEKRC